MIPDSVKIGDEYVNIKAVGEVKHIKFVNELLYRLIAADGELRDLIVQQCGESVFRDRVDRIMRGIISKLDHPLSEFLLDNTNFFDDKKTRPNSIVCDKCKGDMIVMTPIADAKNKNLKCMECGHSYELV
jgi:hypothetical protein